jgi:hypothetical protein
MAASVPASLLSVPLVRAAVARALTTCSWSAAAWLLLSKSLGEARVASMVLSLYSVLVVGVVVVLRMRWHVGSS